MQITIAGKLNYLEKGTCSDMAYSKKEHGESIWWLEIYFKGTRDKLLVLKPDKN